MNSLTWEETIEGVKTNLHISVYHNRVLVVISQTASFGSIMLARGESGVQQLEMADVTVLLGQRDNAASIATAQTLALELMKAGCAKPLMICLGLKQQTLPTVRAAVAAVVRQPIWKGCKPSGPLPACHQMAA